MRFGGNLAVFGISVLVGFLFVVAPAGYDYWKRQPNVEISYLANDIGVAAQIDPDEVAEVRERGFTTIIDLRPDGESPGQPPSKAVESAARALQMGFFYIPVPHGDVVPDRVVTELNKAISNSPSPILLYCRSGRRAARAWSLAEASRTGGLEAAAILEAAKEAGHSVDDLGPAINTRISRRKAVTGESR